MRAKFPISPGQCPNRLTRKVAGWLDCHGIIAIRKALTPSVPGRQDLALPFPAARERHCVPHTLPRARVGVSCRDQRNPVTFGASHVGGVAPARLSSGPGRSKPDPLGSQLIHRGFRLLDRCPGRTDCPALFAFFPIGSSAGACSGDGRWSGEARVIARADAEEILLPGL
jgi:hypothetical protein